MTYDELLDKWLRKLGRPCTAGEIVHDLRQLEQPVRCKDCRWGKEVSGNIECSVDLNLPPEYHGYEWFCPNGERGEDGQTD